MKLAPVTKVEKKNKTILKNFDDDVVSVNCDVIVIFPIYGQFGAIWKSDSVRVLTLTTSVVTFYHTKIENKTKNL